MGCHEGLHRQPYPDTPDEFWVVEHDPLHTQGQAGKAEHLLAPGDIPVVQSDRGGQVTYHGPGQLVLYVLVDVRRSKLTVRELVTCPRPPSSTPWPRAGLRLMPNPTPPASM